MDVLLKKIFIDMKTTFLEYYKTVLDKVSFDHQLFAKEYRKALNNLPPNEIDDLNGWLTFKGLSPVPQNSAQLTQLVHK
jgi:hypothetical protein